MLKSIDVLIGLTVVLLALSMAVTVITQAITTIVNSRGRHLRRGLTDLLRQLDPALTPEVSKALATRVLMHPLVSGSSTPVAVGAADGLLARAAAWLRRVTGGPRLGNVVHREEFTKLLMGLGAGVGSEQVDGPVRSALLTTLSNNGVSDPEATLKNIRTLALQLERTHPELSNMARQNIAILQEAESDLVAKINNWFDQTMDRTSQRFTASTRAVTFAGAFIVAIGLQVDTPSLVNRLAADDALRAALVEESRSMHPPSPGSSSTPDTTRYQSLLATNGIIKLPGEDWPKGFGEANKLGLLLTALLLSLGAPFWYSALGRLLQLRSVIASREDAHRTARQTSDPPVAAPAGGARPSASAPAASAPAASAPAAAGERGDLVAVG